MRLLVLLAATAWLLLYSPPLAHGSRVLQRRERHHQPVAAVGVDQAEALQAAASLPTVQTLEALPLQPVNVHDTSSGEATSTTTLEVVTGDDDSSFNAAAAAARVAAGGGLCTAATLPQAPIGSAGWPAGCRESVQPGYSCFAGCAAGYEPSGLSGAPFVVCGAEGSWEAEVQGDCVPAGVLVFCAAGLTE